MLGVNRIEESGSGVGGRSGVGEGWSGAGEGGSGV